MNKNTHETAFTTSNKFSLTGENYVARRQTEYRHEGNRVMHLEHESRSFRVSAKRSNCRWVRGSSQRNLFKAAGVYLGDQHMVSHRLRDTFAVGMLGKRPPDGRGSPHARQFSEGLRTPLC